MIQTPVKKKRDKPSIEEITQCPECGSTHLTKDYSRVELVCEDCGLVIDEDMIDPYTNSCGGSKWYFTPLKRKIIAQKRLKKYHSKIHWFYDFSYNVVDLLPNDIDFVYMDHRYKDIKKDMELYYPKLKKGGVLAGHDYNLYDVSRAVVEFATKNNLEVDTRRYNVD